MDPLSLASRLGDSHQVFPRYLPLGTAAIGRAALSSGAVPDLPHRSPQLGVNQALGTISCGSGDVDRDGVCNIIDVQLLVNSALGGECTVGD